MYDVIAALEGYTEEDVATESLKTNPIVKVAQKILATLKALGLKFVEFLKSIAGKAKDKVDNAIAVHNFNNALRALIGAISSCRVMEGIFKSAFTGNADAASVKDKMSKAVIKFDKEYEKFSDLAIKVTGGALVKDMSEATQKKTASMLEKTRVAIAQMANHAQTLLKRAGTASAKGAGERADSVARSYLACQSKLVRGLNVLMVKAGMNRVGNPDTMYADA